MKTKLMVLTTIIWAIFPITVTIVYLLFVSEILDITLMNNVIKAGIVLFALVSVLTIYICVKYLLVKNKKNIGLTFPVVFLLAILIAIVLFTPAMLNYFTA